MKKTLKSIFAIAAVVLAIQGCQKAELTNNQGIERTISFTSTSEDVKASFGTPTSGSYPVIWTDANASLKTLLNWKDGTAKANISEDGKTIQFEITTDITGACSIAAVTPADAVSGVTSTKKYFTVNIPTTQTCTAASPDENAQILYTSAQYESLPEKANLTFHHITAYGHAVITNLGTGDEKVNNVSLTAENGWTGRFNVYPEDFESNKAGDVTENSVSKSITVVPESISNVWFACAPVDLGGKTVEVSVSTDKGVFTKNVTIPAGKKFESGKIGKFTVDMTGISPVAAKTFTIVTASSQLKVGAEIIIAAKKFNTAISTTKNPNNIAEAGISKSDKGKTIEAPGANVQIFTLENGLKADSYAFFDGANYICAASSSSNYLRAEEVLSDNSSFKITFAADSTATITAQGTYTKNTIYYNDGSKMFSCYSNAQKPVCIYQYDDGKISLEKTAVDITPNAAAKSIDVIWDNVDHAVNYTVSCTDKADVTVESGAEGCSFTELEYDKTYVVTVTANPEEGYRKSVSSASIMIENPAPVITLGTLSPVAKNGGDISVSYSIDNPVAGKTISAVSSETWVNSFDYATEGYLKFKVDANSTGADRESTITVSYEGAANATLTVSQKGEAFCYEAMDPANVKEGVYFISYEYTDGALYLMKNAIQSSYYTAGTKYAEITKTTTISEDNLFMIEKSGEGYTISCGGKYVNIVKSGDHYNLLPLQAAPSIWKFSASSTGAIAAESAENTGYYMIFDMYGTTPEYTTATTAEKAPMFYYYSAIPSYLYASAEGSTSFSAAGGSLTISVDSNVDWTVSSTDATNFAVSKANATTATVTVFENAGAQRTATITISGTGVDDVKIELIQDSAGTASTYTLDAAAITSAHSSAWAYTSGSKTVNATDGSEWILYNTYCNKNQVTVQMNKGKGSYILTPDVSSKSISKLIVGVSSSNDGKGTNAVTRTFDVLDGETAIISDMKGDDLAKGVVISGDHSQLKIIPNETNGGACYITYVTIEYK